MAGIKTDNHYLADKVRLRLDNLPNKKVVRVLDCFGGTGLVWRAVQRLSGIDIQRTAIDIRNDIDYAHIHGDNIKIIGDLDLTGFDVIDMDAYGVPFDLLEEILPRFTGTCFVTFIQTMQGNLPIGLLAKIGITKTMREKAPTLCSRRGWEYLLEYLALMGVKSLRHRSKSRKHYLHFVNCAAAREEDLNSRKEGMAADPS